MLNKTERIFNPSSGSIKHCFRKVQSHNVRGALGQPDRIAASAATDFDHFATIEIQISLP